MLRYYLKNKTLLKSCKIYGMLRQNARKKHISFHTPGHKIGKWDVTELSFSDNLSCPRGCIAAAERDIAQILGAAKSFLLTDGSTSGILSMLYAAKSLGVKTLAFSRNSHKSVFNGCTLTGITPLVYETQETAEAAAQEADGVLLTSPDYYGKIQPLSRWRAFCDKQNKLLLIDGAHGGHLHFQKEIYAGAYADLWVDGVHKNLPALTQGGVVSARTERLGAALAAAVDIFRTTSPSYPIMASVEYAVKYPRNIGLENAVKAYAAQEKRVELFEDFTKLCALFDDGFAAQKHLESRGVYPEFCDGTRVEFYLSPATKNKDFKALKRLLKQMFLLYPYNGEKQTQQTPAPLVFNKNAETEWLEVSQAKDRICALPCGLFPPCTPLLFTGERIDGQRLALLTKADNVYGLKNGKICVYKQ